MTPQSGARRSRRAAEADKVESSIGGWTIPVSEARSDGPARDRLHSTIERNAMLHYAVVFFLIALVAALFGFGGIAVGAAEIAKILFFVFLVLFVVSLVAGLIRRGP